MLLSGKVPGEAEMQGWWRGLGGLRCGWGQYLHKAMRIHVPRFVPLTNTWPLTLSRGHCAKTPLTFTRKDLCPARVPSIPMIWGFLSSEGKVLPVVYFSLSA